MRQLHDRSTEGLNDKIHRLQDTLTTSQSHRDVSEKLYQETKERLKKRDMEYNKVLTRNNALESTLAQGNNPYSNPDNNPDDPYITSILGFIGISSIIIIHVAVTFLITL